jgi:hypothetical protein
MTRKRSTLTPWATGFAYDASAAHPHFWKCRKRLHAKTRARISIVSMQHIG